MENFIYNDKFYSDLGDLCDDIFETGKEISELPDDWAITCLETNIEPIVKFSLDWIFDRIDEDRFPENESDDRTVTKVQKILSEYINFEKINELMPKLYYEGNKKFNITKKHLLD